jgi:alpha/beta superfamily hydrolase
MKPVLFGGCFGWFHGAAGKRGVVLCSAHGYEGMCVHRVWGGLAERLARAGMPTLRFDYPGAGDSAGHDEEPGRVEAWLGGVRAAMGWMRANAGVEEIALVGLRLGGTLAAAVAAEEGWVDALALLAAPASGKAYARELRALAMMAPPAEGAPAPRPEWQGDLEAAGFVLTAETLADLGRVDLLKLERAPAPRVLLLDRPDAPVDPRLAARLRELGSTVDEAPFEGYAEMMRDAHFAKAPHEAFELLTAWLARGAGPAAAAAEPPPLHPLALPGVVEEAVCFGQDGSLFGVLAAPVSPPPERPALLFLNTGSVHHIGSNRMSVTLSRALAARGFVSLRFDLAGIGDSPAWPGQPENRLYSKDSGADVRAAIDFLETRGIGRCIVIGICSGAYLGFHTAIEEERIVGQVLINAQRLTWREGDSLEIAMRKSFKSTRFYAQTVLRAETWRRVLSGEVDFIGIGRTLVQRALARALNKLKEVTVRATGGAEEQSEVARGFFLLSDRGVETLLVYSDQDSGIDEMELHLGRAAKKLHGRRNVRIEIIQGADHTLTARWARERFAHLLDRFLAATW